MIRFPMESMNHAMHDGRQDNRDADEKHETGIQREERSEALPCIRVQLAHRTHSAEMKSTQGCIDVRGSLVALSGVDLVLVSTMIR
jgi:hypothetical protein